MSIISAFLVLVVLFGGYQNCSWSGAETGYKGANYDFNASSGNGESYDGKPERDYLRHIPGYTCGGVPSEYGSLDIEGNRVRLIVSEGENCSEEKEIPLSELYTSPNTDVVVGYKEAIYTKAESDLATSPESFTEAWCQHKTENGRKVVADIIVQWEQAGKTATGYIFDEQGANSVKTSLERKIRVNEVRYASEEFSLTIHKISKVGASHLYSGHYINSSRFGYEKIPIECRMGGQFDPKAPRLTYPQSSVTFEVGQPIEFAPIVSHSDVTFAVDKPLPEGLVLDKVTGRVHGTPLKPQTRNIYEVTMQFKFGDVVAPLSIGTGRRIEVTTTNLGLVDSSSSDLCLSGGECSLNAALRLANSTPESPLIIDLVGGTYTLNGQELLVEGDVVLSGETTKATTFDAQGRSRIFQVASGAFLELDRLHLSNGYAPEEGSALRAQGAIVIIKNSLFADNLFSGLSGQGGAVFFSGGEALEIYDSRFLRNRMVERNSTLSGGAIYVKSAQRVIIKGSEFSENHSYKGGALYLDLTSSSPVLLEENRFANNDSVKRGGGMMVERGFLYLKSLTFTGNSSIYYGGALAVDRPRALRVANSVFTDNLAPFGSAINSNLSYYDVVNTVESSQFSGNRSDAYSDGASDDGSVIFILEGSYILKNSAFQNNFGQNNCQVVFSGDGAKGFGVLSYGGNTFEDQSCSPMVEDTIID